MISNTNTSQDFKCCIYMFGDGTLVDLLRFNKVIQARAKVPSWVQSGAPGTQAHILLNTNTCSIDAPQAHLCAHVRAGLLGGASGSVNQKLETHTQIVNRRAPGTSVRTCACRSAGRSFRVSEPETWNSHTHCQLMRPRRFQLAQLARILPIWPVFWHASQ
jgi:hypothetical protein